MDNKQPTHPAARPLIHADKYAGIAVAVLLLLGCGSALALATFATPIVRGLLVIPTPAPTPTITTARAGTNLAYGKPVTVSRALSDFPAYQAVDGNWGNWWGSGSPPPEWIEVDLGAQYAISEIRLLPSQSPPGETLHHLSVRGIWTQDRYLLLHVFEGQTADYLWLSFKLAQPIRGVRFVRIDTVKSPSWVSWREIQVIGGG